MNSALIEYTVEHSVAHIRFARPEKKNAVINEMWQQLSDVLTEAEGNDDVRVIVFSGQADNFTAGYDLSDFLHRPPLQADAPIFQFLNGLAHAQKPLIAAVEGVAVGIGTTLLLHCDFAYAANNARFQMPFVNLALCPEAASSYLLPMLCGQRRAAQWLMLGDVFSAQDACDNGLVNQVLDTGKVLDAAMNTAAKLAQKPPAALRMTKALMKRGMRQSIADTLTIESESFAQLLQSAEAKEAFSAFLEKRLPDFSKMK